MAKEVLVTAKKLKNRKKFYKQAKWILLFILIFLIIVYIILEVTYNGGHFTISLDKNTTLKQNLLLFQLHQLNQIHCHQIKNFRWT